MHVIEVTWRHRNDFTAIYYCRHCGHKEKIGGGYADAYYQEKVIPSFHCGGCGKNESGEVSKSQPEAAE